MMTLSCPVKAGEEAAKAGEPGDTGRDVRDFKKNDSRENCVVYD